MACSKINVWDTFINKNLISIIHTAGWHLLACQVQWGHFRNINMYSIICQQSNNVSKSFRTHTDLQLSLPAANYGVLCLFGMVFFIGKWQRGYGIPVWNIDALLVIIWEWWYDYTAWSFDLVALVLQLTDFDWWRTERNSQWYLLSEGK